jgi:hypothetical protein
MDKDRVATPDVGQPRDRASMVRPTKRFVLVDVTQTSVALSPPLGFERPGLAWNLIFIFLFSFTTTQPCISKCEAE